MSPVATRSLKPRLLPAHANLEVALQIRVQYNGPDISGNIIIGIVGTQGSVYRSALITDRVMRICRINSCNDGLTKVYRVTERYWHKMLCSRSCDASTGTPSTKSKVSAVLRPRP
ncbi:hypothetical protein ABID19_006753 [Mesorhizobium robiniae]|uniref:Uncharacterized protein n=1 Tax=Mesorhizobium robiniae TaxID=559315 RepID=A0ABV2GZH2_9HYPH